MKFKSLALALTCFSAYSQNTLSYSSIESHYNNGVELFGKKAYSSARKEFQNYISLSAKSLNPNKFNLANAEYYSAMSSLYSKALDADIEVERFVLNHGDHPKAKIIYADLAQRYYERGEYKDAIRYYEKALSNRADNLDTYEIRYQLGVSYYQLGDFQNALTQFDYVKGTVIENAVNAAYYAAVINFRNGNFDLALTDLRRVENVPAYRTEVPNWIGQILYKQKQYDELLAYAEPIIAKPEGRKYDDLALLAGEVSYFNNNYEKAALYYDKYKALKKSNTSNQVTFRHAFSLYKTGKFESASALFKTIAGDKDEIGQQSAYYLGICALRTGDLNAAMTAFDVARKGTFDASIKEEAQYNYVKVLVEKGNNQQAIVDLQNYVKEYPNGKYVDETNELLSEILFETNNYVAALKYIEGLSRTTPKIDEAYQKLAYSQGVQEYNSGRFANAIQYFDKSLVKVSSRDLAVQAKLWKAESMYQQDQIQAAEPLYRELLTSSDKIARLKSQYALGYMSFNNERYSEALRFFQDFKSGGRGEASLQTSLDDANLRIGDCFLMAKNFSQALQVYDDAFKGNTSGKDYALYQKGMALRYLGRENEAKNTFDQFSRTFPNSRLLDEVLFQNGNLAMEAGNYNGAINTFSNILKRQTNSELTAHVLLRRGIAYSNVEKYDNAISDFKQILNKFGKSKYASEAFLGIREALSQANRSEEFFEIAEVYKKNNPEGSSVQGLQFETAKDLFFAEKYDAAISAFTKFISQYPGSVYTPEANYLIGESYLGLKKTTEALKYYQTIVNEGQLEYLSQAASRSAAIYFEKKQFEEAARNYNQVVNTTSDQREMIVAYEGWMKSQYELKKYDQTLELAEKILTTGPEVVVGAKNRAELYKGKAYMGMSNWASAKTQFEKTIELGKDVSAAEAKYRLGEIQYKQKEYDASIKTMQELASNYSDFLEWYENAFLLIADNYLGKNDSFMAKATLNSIIENSENAETVAKARQKLNAIK